MLYTKNNIKLESGENNNVTYPSELVDDLKEYNLKDKNLIEEKKLWESTVHFGTVKKIEKDGKYTVNIPQTKTRNFLLNENTLKWTRFVNVRPEKHVQVWTQKPLEDDITGDKNKPLPFFDNFAFPLLNPLRYAVPLRVSY